MTVVIIIVITQNNHMGAELLLGVAVNFTKASLVTCVKPGARLCSAPDPGWESPR